MPTTADHLANAIRDALLDLLAENHPETAPIPYGVEILNANKSASRFDLILTFRAGVTYCCQEPVCHLRLDSPHGWAIIRETLDARALRQPPPMRINRITTIVEPGARFTTHAAFDLPIETTARQTTTAPGWSEPATRG